MKLEIWADLFKTTREVLDDDYNPGQRVVAKAKGKSSNGSTEFSTTFKSS